MIKPVYDMSHIPSVVRQIYGSYLSITYIRSHVGSVTRGPYDQTCL